LLSIFEEILGRSRASPAPAVLGSVCWSGDDLMQAVEAMSAVLVAAGAGMGTTIGVALEHSPTYIAAMLAARHAGSVFVPMQPGAKTPEKIHALTGAGCRFLLTDRPDRDLLDALGAVRLRTLSDCVLFRLPIEPTFPTQAGDCMIVHTSGSTGRPTGVVLTDQAISANVRAVADYLSLGAADRCVVFTPPAYCYAISQILTHLWAGGAVLPWADGMNRPKAMLAAARTFGVTGLQANPTMFEMLLFAQRRAAISLPAVRYVMSGGQPLFSTLARSLKAAFPAARLVNMYGCTENAPRISRKWLPDDVPDRDAPWPVGKPVVGTKIRIASEAGTQVERGKVGEITIAGTSLMRGYLGAAQATAERVKDGWFATRDLGFIDENGDLCLVGRLDNIITVGHEKVAPEEIEAVLLSVEGVRDVAVGAAPNRLLGQMPVALVVHDGELESLLPHISRRCEETLSRVKIPRYFFSTPAIARTPYGKIDRAALRVAIREALPTR
jgi:long-chain acyl-CoA synthetase